MKVAALSCLAYSQFHLFLHLKKHVAGHNFHEDEEFKNEVATWLRGQAAIIYGVAIQNLVPRLNICLGKGGDYVEK